jgi:hypothetical protein
MSYRGLENMGMGVSALAQAMAEGYKNKLALQRELEQEQYKRSQMELANKMQLAQAQAQFGTLNPETNQFEMGIPADFLSEPKAPGFEQKSKEVEEAVKKSKEIKGKYGDAEFGGNRSPAIGPSKSTVQAPQEQMSPEVIASNFRVDPSTGMVMMPPYLAKHYMELAQQRAKPSGNSMTDLLEKLVLQRPQQDRPPPKTIPRLDPRVGALDNDIKRLLEEKNKMFLAPGIPNPKMAAQIAQIDGAIQSKQAMKDQIAYGAVDKRAAAIAAIKNKYKVDDKKAAEIYELNKNKINK